MHTNKQKTQQIIQKIQPATLVAATKYVTISELQPLYEAGVSIFGENKVQDFLVKYEQCTLPVSWHFIGTLQTNKVKYIIDKVALIHSVDTFNLIKEIQKQALKHNIIVSILLQVNISQESSKHGFKKEQIKEALTLLEDCSNIECHGLMMMAPLIPLEETRIYFKETKLLLEEMNCLFPNQPLNQLSMGMSNDYMIAKEEGATLIRIGSALFDK